MFPLPPCDLVHGNIAQISFFAPLFRRIHSNNIFVFGWSERERKREREGEDNVMRILLTKSLEYISHCLDLLLQIISFPLIVFLHRSIRLRMHFYENCRHFFGLHYSGKWYNFTHHSLESF